MQGNEDDSNKLDKLAELRRQAQNSLKKSINRDFKNLSALEISNIVQNLETHQIELQMQNEEMQIAQRDLLVVRDQYAELYDHAPVGYLTISDKGIILKTNLTFADMLKSPRAGLVRQLFSSLVINEDQNAYYRFLGSLIKSQTKQRCVLRLSSQALTPFWVSIESTFAKSDKIEVKQFHMIITDINEQKQQDFDRAQLQRELQQVSKMAAVGQLAGGIAHDFNNILGIIMGYTELARLNIFKNTEDKLHYQLSQIMEASERGRDIISKMMSFSYQSKASVIHLNAATELKEVIDMLKPILPSSLSININMASNLPDILMDKTKFNQLVMNLVINARDAMDKHGELSIQLNWQKDLDNECVDCHKQIKGDWIALVISDTGSGISPKLLKRIFEPFYTTKKIGKGSGMGLAIVTGIIHGLGGHILVSSTLNQGTSIKILIPPALNNQQEQSIITDEKIESLEGQGEKILIIDDEASLANCVSELLEENGYQTVVYDNSLKAVDYFSENPEYFDLVITDQTMPHLTGLEVATKLRQLNHDLPIIISSGNFDAIDIDYAKSLDVFLLEKPVTTRILYKTVKKLLHH